MDQGARDRTIIRTSLVGIGANAALAALKAAVGILTGSIAILLDAVNNLSDALSSLITIIGTHLAARPADHKHPYGYGRIEYLSAIIIASIVLTAGLTSLRESVMAILKPATPSYDTTALVILAVAVGVKIALGRYFVGVGRKVSSDSLVASGTDASMDAVISAATVVAALLYLGTGIGIEAWLGAVISLVIVKSGIEILQETLSKVLGERVDASLSQAVKRAAEEVDGVEGAYDLFLYDHGPERLQGSVHVAVNEDLSAAQVDTITKCVQEHVMRECGVILVAVGIYASNDEESAAGQMRARIAQIVWSHDHIREMHGFYVDEPHKHVRFDVIIGFDDHDRLATRDAIERECREAFPSYDFTVILDSDVSD